MRTITIRDVPRRIYSHVLFRVPPNDEENFWRLYWYMRQYRRGKAAERLMFIITMPLFLWLTVRLDSFAWTIGLAATWVFIAFSIRRYARYYIEHCDVIYHSNPAKWQIIGDSLRIVSEACKPGDPTLSITITLPDD